MDKKTVPRGRNYLHKTPRMGEPVTSEELPKASSSGAMKGEAGISHVAGGGQSSVQDPECHGKDFGFHSQNTSKV